MKVAIYLRKSRGEVDDLAKHKLQLMEIVDKNNWEYDLYEEIGSSDSLDERPKINKLLDNIEDYSKVLVVAIDRLSRNELDQAFITKIFRINNIELITPTKVYDFNEEGSVMISDFEKLLARQEYRLIKKRFRDGKLNGAKQGKWINGTPPIPYRYDKISSKIEIDKENLKVYRFIIEKLLEGYSTNNLAFKLNEMGIKTINGRQWKANTVRRIATDTTHLGKIHFNGKEYPGNHEPVKTLEEHQNILLFLNRKTRAPKRKAIKHTYILNGIVKCAKCGSTMSTYKKSNGTYYLKPCWKTDAVGNKCGNRGSNADIIIDNIKLALNNYINNLQDEINKGIDNRQKKESLSNEIELLNNNLVKLSNKKLKVREMILEELFNIKEGKIEIEKIIKEENKIKEVIDLINTQITSLSKEDKEKSILNARAVLNELYSNSNDEELNKLIKSIVKCIIWNRDGDDINIDIKFL